MRELGGGWAENWGGQTRMGNNLLDSSTALGYYLAHGEHSYERTKEPARSDSVLLEPR
jgi:hypothetical protein